jgi:hypothetical protein
MLLDGPETIVKVILKSWTHPLVCRAISDP